MTDEEAAAPRAAERAKATGDLDRVTDYVEERELDASAAADKMRTVLAAAQAQRAAAKRERANQDDVKAIVDELEVDAKAAERALLDADGDVVAALRALMR